MTDDANLIGLHAGLGVVAAWVQAAAGANHGITVARILKCKRMEAGAKSGLQGQTQQQEGID